MDKKFFSEDVKPINELKISEGKPIENVARTITSDVSEDALNLGVKFAKAITDGFVSDFEKPGDKMAHVSTFTVIDDTVYMAYYANTKEPSEDPKNQTARFAWAPVNDIENKTFNTHEELIAFLKENGFPVYDYFKVLNGFEELKKNIEQIDVSKKDLDILIDGAVVKVNNVKLRSEIGYTSKFPKWAVAFKFEAQELTTTLNEVVWQVGRTGKLTPIGIVDPIELSGATVKRATLNNYGDILRKQVMLNSTVFVRRSNEVIPEIVKVA